MAAQAPCTVYYDEYNGLAKKEIRFSGKTEALRAISRTYSQLLSEGFLDALLDTLCSDSAIKVSVTTGDRYLLKNITIIMDSSNVVYESNVVKKNTAFDVELINMNADMAITELENRGFPFASLQLESLTMDKERNADVTFLLNTGPRMVLDSIIIASSGKVPERYVRSYLNMRKGDLYNEEKMLGLQRQLRELTFLQSKRPAEVVFRQGKYDLYLFLEKKKANYFNGIVGLRPNETTGKINITGDAEVRLLNALNTGEEIYLNWKKLQPQTQDLTVRTSLPYLFSTPLGIDGELKIYRRDSTFSTVKSSLGLVFNFGGNDKLKVFAEKNLTSQLANYVTATSLGNVNSTLYGLAVQKERLDYRLNPRKGYALKAELATGTRTVGDNNINTADNPLSITKRSINRGELSLEYYLPTWKSQCIRLASQGAAMNAESLFDNETFRIGGLRTFRGVNEESIFATTWAMLSIEYRLLFEENSALYLFADQSWYEKRTVNQYITDTPLGFGAGVNFETGAGIFTFNYALGSQFDAPILIRNAKISFGFRNLF